MELLKLLKQYANIIGAYKFDYQYHYKEIGEDGNIDQEFALSDIDIYFRSDEKIIDSMTFETEEKAIEGMKGIIQFKQNAA